MSLAQFARELRKPVAPVREPERPQERRNCVRATSCKRRRVWVPRDKALVERYYEISTGSLKKKLRNENAIRLRSLAPWVVAPVTVKPVEHATAEPFLLRCRDIVRGLPRLSATHKRILALLTERVGEEVSGREIFEVAGIHEWARRLRELRVEHGYKIARVRAGQNSAYRLEAVEPDRDAAERWREMNRIRRDPQHGARDRILALFQANVGRPVNMDELRYVANVHEVGRRVRELRVEHGYVITSHMDRTGLRPGEYVLESLQQLPANERITAEQRTRILERDGYRCQLCGWGIGDPPAHGKRFVEVHHRLAVQDGGGSEDANLETLCNVCHDAIPV
jgi:5-methylcytosine-specific restriction endonuclease McrA